MKGFANNPQPTTFNPASSLLDVVGGGTFQHQHQTVAREHDADAELRNDDLEHLDWTPVCKFCANALGKHVTAEWWTLSKLMPDCPALLWCTPCIALAIVGNPLITWGRL